MLSKILILATLILATLSQHDIYWRDFTGSIPQDAVVGAKSFGYNIYIGRAPLNTTGVYPGQIVPGLDYVMVSSGGVVHNLNVYPEILCSGLLGNLTWFNTTSESFPNITTSRLVRGGYYNANQRPFYIGRTLLMPSGEYAVGHVNGFELTPNSTGMLFVNNGTVELGVKSYQILAYL